MGTSISQRSPHRGEDAGEKWAEVCTDVTSGAAPKTILPKIIEAYKEQFGGTAQQLIVDAGVRKVETMLKQLQVDGSSRLILKHRLRKSVQEPSRLKQIRAISKITGIKIVLVDAKEKI